MLGLPGVVELPGVLDALDRSELLGEVDEGVPGVVECELAACLPIRASTCADPAMPLNARELLLCCELLCAVWALAPAPCWMLLPAELVPPGWVLLLCCELVPVCELGVELR